MDPLTKAILADDLAGVRRLLAAEPALATRVVRKARLFTSRIHHWLYVGDTALHLAAAGHRARIVRCLLTAGADPNAAGNHRHGRPLHYAADGYRESPEWDATRQVETLHVLIDAGAEIDARDKNGATALHRAVRTRCAEATAWLLQAGSDPRARNEAGSTPFHLAVQNTGRGGSGTAAAKAAQRQIIASLLAAGASSDLKNAAGKSVRDSATSEWVREML